MGSSAAHTVGGGSVVHAQARDRDPTRQPREPGRPTAHHGCASRYLAMSARSQAPFAITTR